MVAYGESGLNGAGAIAPIIWGISHLFLPHLFLHNRVCTDISAWQWDQETGTSGHGAAAGVYGCLKTYGDIGRRGTPG